MKRYRIGIDVGGTFTHAVAMDSTTLALAGKAKVPTTHRAAEGVGLGVVEALRSLMGSAGIQASEVAFIAHSTTQATNSLLEGDVEKVLILSTGHGRAGSLTRRAARLGRIPLSPGRFLETRSHHVRPGDARAEDALLEFLSQGKKDGYRVAIVVGPFSVDHPELERNLADFVREQGLLVTSTHEVTQLYGVRVRARTTAINASILPKMMEVAETTSREIRKLGITAPLMIMRSDGGVMSLEEMRKKPILTLLSGPAAGIAAALRFLKISDGIFLEVGGTSTDISVIRNGRAVIRSATIGGNRTYLKTLDCRTLGIGGGSVPRVSGHSVTAVGPRSAHIAGVHYAAFESGRLGDSGIRSLEAHTVQPRAGDPKDYLVFESIGERVTLTPTCAANALGLVPDRDAARAGEGFPSPAWDTKLATAGYGSLQQLSESILAQTSKTVGLTVKRLMKEYRLRPEWVKLVGGGGGASAIVPHLAQSLGLGFEIAEEADVISAIGVALGLVQETVERSVVNPTREEIYRVREAAAERVLAQGADPATVEVFVEVDPQKNLIRASAQGAIGYTSARTDGAHERAGQVLSALPAWDVLATRALGLPKGLKPAEEAASTGLKTAAFECETPRFLGLGRKKIRHGVVVDQRGVVRMKLPSASVVQTRVGALLQALDQGLESRATYGDAGVIHPYAYALIGERIVDLSRLAKKEHQLSVLELELKGAPPEDPAALIFSFEGSETE